SFGLALLAALFPTRIDANQNYRSANSIRSVTAHRTHESYLLSGQTRPLDKKKKDSLHRLGKVHVHKYETLIQVGSRGRDERGFLCRLSRMARPHKAGYVACA